MARARYVESRNDTTVKSKEQYAWAIPHIEKGLGAIRLARLDRDDVATWIENLAASGKLSRRSVQICRNAPCRTRWMAVRTEWIDLRPLPAAGIRRSRLA